MLGVVLLRSRLLPQGGGATVEQPDFSDADAAVMLAAPGRMLKAHSMHFSCLLLSFILIICYSATVYFQFDPV